jgi:hypothetical protein|nr:MAG TPA: hypothetical protein [Crassvirales sp.]
MLQCNDCRIVKSLRIGQSAAKTLSNKSKVQRLRHGVLQVMLRMVKSLECGTLLSVVKI